jgi:toxin ParE1/3/4
LTWRIDFRMLLKDTLEGLLEAPGKGRPREVRQALLREVRSWPVKGFPSIPVFYQATAYGIRVLRIIHGARDIDSALERSDPL